MKKGLVVTTGPSFVLDDDVRNVFTFVIDVQVNLVFNVDVQDDVAIYIILITNQLVMYRITYSQLLFLIGRSDSYVHLQILVHIITSFIKRGVFFRETLKNTNRIIKLQKILSSF